MPLRRSPSMLPSSPLPIAQSVLCFLWDIAFNPVPKLIFQETHSSVLLTRVAFFVYLGAVAAVTGHDWLFYISVLGLVWSDVQVAWRFLALRLRERSIESETVETTLNDPICHLTTTPKISPLEGSELEIELDSELELDSISGPDITVAPVPTFEQFEDLPKTVRTLRRPVLFQSHTEPYTSIFDFEDSTDPGRDMVEDFNTNSASLQLAGPLGPRRASTASTDQVSAMGQCQGKMVRPLGKNIKQGKGATPEPIARIASAAKKRLSTSTQSSCLPPSPPHSHHSEEALEEIPSMEALGAESTTAASSRTSFDGNERPPVSSVVEFPAARNKPLPIIDDVISEYESSVRSQSPSPEGFEKAEACHDESVPYTAEEHLMSGDESHDDIFSEDEAPYTPNTPDTPDTVLSETETLHGARTQGFAKQLTYEKEQVEPTVADTKEDVVTEEETHQSAVVESTTPEEPATPEPVDSEVVETAEPVEPAPVSPQEEQEQIEPISTPKAENESRETIIFNTPKRANSAPILTMTIRPTLTRQASTFVKSEPWKPHNRPKPMTRKSSTIKKKKVPKKMAGSPKRRRQALSRRAW